MANRRMFSNRVIDRASFLRLAPTARLLYYDLGMKADDDGFVEAFTVMRTTGAGEDDLHTLESKGFIRIIDDDLLSWIPDWLENNQLRADRYHPSMHRDILDKLKNVNQMATIGIPDGNQTETEVTLSKGISGKDIIVKSTSQSADSDYDDYFKRHFPIGLKDLLSSWVGFKYVSVDRLRELIFDDGIEPEVIVWIACKTMDSGANSPISYFNATLQQKCAEECCITLQGLIDCEKDDYDMIKRIIHEVNKRKNQIKNEFEGKPF